MGTAKNLIKEGGTDCTEDEQIAGGRAAKHHALVKLRALMASGRRNFRKPEGGRKLSKTMRSMLRYYACEDALSDALKKEFDAEEEHYGRLPDRSVAYTTFEERQVGDLVSSCDRSSRDFPCSIVSLALFDGDTMLFACSGIPLRQGRSKLHLTRFVTSARLVTEYISKRYRDDKLRIEVRLPNGHKIGGFLELYNRHIAIVTSLGVQNVYPVDVDLPEGLPSSNAEMLAAGHAFGSGCLMALKVKLTPCSDDAGCFFPMSIQVDLSPTEKERLSIWKPFGSYEDGPVAVLGGPVLGEGNRIIGMNIDIGYDGPRANAYVSFLPLGLLCRYLKHFQILNPKELHFRGYLLPYGVHTLVPSAFMRRINRIRHYGYPMPPPLMLQLNGELCNTFEECFGESLAWKGYPFNVRRESYLGVWRQIPKDVVTDISRRVVSIASYHGYERYFVCTGLLIKWHQRTVILTSASLVRSCDNQDKVDDSLKIEVFLPPKQRGSGRLELYNLNYNIAVVSVEKKFISVRPEVISNNDSMPNSSGKVVAVGREPRQGLLMASIGEVKRRDKDCKDLKLSTCKIKKAGIGGPLINFDGSFVGMNFFDGRMLTPFLPRSKTVQVLRSKINVSLPSAR
uniref:Uncharacterized protein n=1 Tax=Avena sativa TaxID=4498 RepID=A0ACD5YV76_AVESA